MRPPITWSLIATIFHCPQHHQRAFTILVQHYPQMRQTTTLTRHHLCQFKQQHQQPLMTPVSPPRLPQHQQRALGQHSPPLYPEWQFSVRTHHLQQQPPPVYKMFLRVVTRIHSQVLSEPALISDVNSTQDGRVQHSQQLIEALAKVTQTQRLPQSKPAVFRADEKDKTKFFLWEKAFDALVGSAPVADLQKLHLLYQQLDGRAKRVVEQLQYMMEDPAKAYTEARKILKERFGHTASIETDFENKLSNWPKIGANDAQGIQEFGDFLQQVKIAS